MSAVLSPAKKDKAHIGYYFNVDAEDTLTVGGGLHMPSTPELRLVRNAIAVNGKRLDAILSDPHFRDVFGELDGNPLKKMPRDFPADHPYALYLRCRDFTVVRTAQASPLSDAALLAEVVGPFRTLQPLVRFLDEATTPPTADAAPATNVRDIP